MNFGTRRLATSAGFSLIELLTVLSIVAIGASLAAPEMANYVNQTRTRRALDQLVADISRTRLMAVEQGRPAALRLRSDGSYAIEVQGTSGSWTTVHTVQLREDFRGVMLYGDVSALEFSSRGLVTNLTGESYIRVTANGITDSVFISPAGRAYRDF